MKIAIVHEWLVNYAGSERVLEQIIRCYPQADLYCVVDFLTPIERGFLQEKTTTQTFIQYLPGARRFYRQYLPLMPLAIEQLDLSQYDVILSSSHAVAKGVIIGPDQMHISYIHSPIRYAWDLQHQYLKESGLSERPLGWVARWLLHKIRIWDVRTANGVDHFVANSQFIARRIRRIYGRQSKVIYPPVDVDSFKVADGKQDYYLAASRMVPYKKMDLIVQAFSSMPDRRLVVIGDGPDLGRIKIHAKQNIELLGYQPFEALRDYMQHARAFVFAAEEDFGITPVEAQACGTPVIAFRKGGAIETIVGLDSENPTGVFFDTQSIESICDAVDRFEGHADRITSANCRRNAERFSSERFRREFIELVETSWNDFRLN